MNSEDGIVLYSLEEEPVQADRTSYSSRESVETSNLFGK